jgi:hypothetical protein
MAMFRFGKQKSAPQEILLEDKTPQNSDNQPQATAPVADPLPQALDSLGRPIQNPQGPPGNNTDSSNALPMGGPIQQLKAVGSSGSELFAGYFTEEYLQTLRGYLGAKKFDEMRRSDAIVRMVLNAMKNPIKGGTFELEAADPTLVPNAQQHADLVDHIRTTMIDWDTHLNEACSCIDFGYALFEQVDQPVINHPRFGSFNGLAGLGFRSQKTIRRWKVDRQSGKLNQVEQWVLGDLTPQGGTIVNMDAQFLAIMSNEKEGDNYEGIGVLRPMYGPYFRKNLYLKIAAIGAEKAAIGTPVGTIPAQKKQDDPEVLNFIKVLQNFVAHETAFITIPQGWTVEFTKNDFDPQKMVALIQFENTEMIMSAVANFLALGMGGSSVGSFALGDSLGEFFLANLQSIANIICGVWNRVIIPRLVRLNFGPQQAYPVLKASNIDSKAGEDLAKVLKLLSDAQVIRPDQPLEDLIRKLYQLPKADLATKREVKPTGGLGVGGGGGSFAEKKIKLSEKWKRRQIKLAETYKKQWDIDKGSVKKVMQDNLKSILQNYEGQIRSGWKNATAAQRRNLALQLTPKGVSDFKNALQEILAQVATNALAAAKKETPKASKLNIKLSDRIRLAVKAPRGGYFDALPDAIKNIIKNAAGLVVQTQTADLNKIVTFQFASSADSTQDVDQVLTDIDGAVLPTLDDGATGQGMSIDAAAGNAVSRAVNQARMEWFFEPEVLDTLESFTFTNEDPVSPICQELDDTTWAKGDPDIDRYTPPLHHNCKSRIVPNENGDPDNPDISRGTAVSQKALDSMTLHECKRPFNLDFKLVEPRR